tara:strand:- start:287 stop:409 length:123 start_codon:yes stop_codon:yes gene_type:complete
MLLISKIDVADEKKAYNIDDTEYSTKTNEIIREREICVNI